MGRLDHLGNASGWRHLLRTREAEVGYWSSGDENGNGQATLPVELTVDWDGCCLTGRWEAAGTEEDRRLDGPIASWSFFRKSIGNDKADNYQMYQALDKVILEELKAEFLEEQ